MVVNSAVDELFFILHNAKSHLFFLSQLLLAVWLVNIASWIFSVKLYFLGIYPRRVLGFIGVAFAPIPHYDINHLFVNSIPFFFLGGILIGFGKAFFLLLSCSISLISGIFIWLFARSAFHIGASGLVSGYLGAILALVYFQGGLILSIIGIGSLVYFGGIILGLFPDKPWISWEAHLSGFLSGIIFIWFVFHYPEYAKKLLAMF